jgi:hypothetical protein
MSLDPGVYSYVPLSSKLVILDIDSIQRCCEAHLAAAILEVGWWGKRFGLLGSRSRTSEIRRRDFVMNIKLQYHNLVNLHQLLVRAYGLTALFDISLMLQH